jgi:hypothetical protein
MTQWIVFAHHEDATSAAWGPFRSVDKADEVFRYLLEELPDDTIISMESLEPSTPKALRHYVLDKS